MTTERPRRGASRLGATLLVAPLAAGSLALGTDWVVQHDQVVTASAPGHSQPATTAHLRQRTQSLALALQQSQSALLRLEGAVRQRARQLQHLEGATGRIHDVRRTGAVPLPAPVAVPAAPPVNATTGAS